MADEVAIQLGGRVIMCDTHEPPRTMGMEETTAQSVWQSELPM